MSTAFVSVPLFSGISEEGLQGLGEVFERVEAEAGTVLFSTGDTADRLYLLVDGRVALHEEGESTIDLQPISLIGELGAMVGLNRRVTAVAVEPSMFLAASGEALRAFFERNASVAVTFYQNLLGMSADKIRRDERRIDDMRRNLIKTQKSLKAMRELILESASNELSEPLHDMLEHLIAQNRRANYVVAPPSALPVHVRLTDGATVPVLAMSRLFIELPTQAGDAHSAWRGVLVLPSSEIPLAGTLEAAGSDAVRVNLDLLIEEYSQGLEAYLTQAQLLDIVL
ncbi:MAG: cyclic nucleotide-binding domain-containing protein [Deltaproteobacteria bacterium]|jgi:CRP-like cAMP-binding protein|nr:cyclic nucleotide-binding domain-containing protein [Deltaproteobacteria bacterium]